MARPLKNAARTLNSAAEYLRKAYEETQDEQRKKRIEQWYEATNHLKNDIVLHAWEDWDEDK